MCPAPDGIPGPFLNAHLAENFPYGYLDGVDCCDTLAIPGTVCLGPGMLAIPGTFYCLFAGHCPESNLAHSSPGRSPLSVCHRTSNRILVGSDHLSKTFPRLVIVHPEAQYVGPVPLADLTYCTHTSPWSDTPCTESTLCIPMWNDRDCGMLCTGLPIKTVSLPL